MSGAVARALVLALGLGSALTGCLTALPGQPTPPTPPPSAQAALAAAHQQRAEALERQGWLRAALDELTIALTVQPGDVSLSARVQSLQAQIQSEAARRFAQGRDALARGDAIKARRHFLAVLALTPGDPKALEALRSEVKDITFITHTVSPQETLVSIAQQYYGTGSQANVLSDINGLPSRSPLPAGTTVRVPRIPGIPANPAASAPAADPSRGGAAPNEVVEDHPVLAQATDALERRNYAAALAHVETILAAHPRSAEGRDLKRMILFGVAKNHYEQKKYVESHQALSELAKLTPNHEEFAGLMRQVRARLVVHHYNQGVRFYREEKLVEAIAEWRVVLDLDPKHGNARKHIEQAEGLLRKLNERGKK